MRPKPHANGIEGISSNLTESRDSPFSQIRHLILGGLLAAVCSFASTGTAAAPLQVPALLDPASQEHHIGKVIFVELVTPDIGVAKQFYGNLFGWTFRDFQNDSTEYAQASLDGRTVAGLIHKTVPPGEHRQPAWFTFFAVRDVDAAKTTALQHGAKVLSNPHEVPNRGREAVFSDPQGAVFAVLASSSGDPDDSLSLPGEWIWSSLIAGDADTDAAFYQAMFDYEVFELPAQDGVKHLMLASDDYARASANSMPVRDSSSHPHWLNYVRVDDTVKMTEKVVALGGRVLAPPHVDRHGGKVAVVADPGGAPFGLLEWPNTESKEVGK